jgi:hypothetical protein
LFEAYRLTVPDVFHGEAHLRDRIAACLVPQALSERFRRTEASFEELLDGLSQELRAFDPTLADALGTSRRKILYQISKVKAKAAREAMRRNQRAGEEATYLYGLVYPNRHMQERFYTILPFLARHGPDLIGRLYDRIRLDCPDHQIAVI